MIVSEFHPRLRGITEILHTFTYSIALKKENLNGKSVTSAL